MKKLVAMKKNIIIYLPVLLIHMSLSHTQHSWPLCYFGTLGSQSCSFIRSLGWRICLYTGYENAGFSVMQRVLLLCNVGMWLSWLMYCMPSTSFSLSLSSLPCGLFWWHFLPFPLQSYIFFRFFPPSFLNLHISHWKYVFVFYLSLRQYSNISFVWLNIYKHTVSVARTY